MPISDFRDQKWQAVAPLSHAHFGLSWQHPRSVNRNRNRLRQAFWGNKPKQTPACFDPIPSKILLTSPHLLFSLLSCIPSFIPSYLFVFLWFIPPLSFVHFLSKVSGGCLLAGSRQQYIPLTIDTTYYYVLIPGLVVFPRDSWYCVSQ